MWRSWLGFLIIGVSLLSGQVTAERLAANPLLTVAGTPEVGDNINGPSLIRVPDWVRGRLGKYYLYFGHHKGRHIRMAYADRIAGPWKLYQPGMIPVEQTAFFRPQPDPVPSPEFFYTHVASPEVFVDNKQKRLVMFFHGMWTNGQTWPSGNDEAVAWARKNGYAQYTQSALSTDGLQWVVQPAISRDSYLRVVNTPSGLIAMARLGLLMRANNLTEAFSRGPNPFDSTSYANRVRHVALLARGAVLHVFFTAIGDAPEHLLHTTIDMRGDWKSWRIGPIHSVLQPEEPYECPTLPVVRSQRGEIDGPAKQMRDPAIFEEDGKVYLLYTICGEQGIAAAELKF